MWKASRRRSSAASMVHVSQAYRRTIGLTGYIGPLTLAITLTIMSKIHYTRFPVTSLCQLVTDLLATRPTTSWQQVAVMVSGKRHDTTYTTDFAHANLLRTCHGLLVYVADLLRICLREVANFLQTCFGETVVMDYGLYQATPFVLEPDTLLKCV